MQTRAATCPRTRQLAPHLFSRNEQLLSCIANLQLWIPALQRRFSTQFSLKSHRSSGKFEKTFHGSPLMMWQTDSFGDASISRTDSCQPESRSSLDDTYEFPFYPPQLSRGGRWTSFAWCFAIFWNIVKTSHRYKLKNIVQNITSLSKKYNVLSDVWGFKILQF